VSGFNRIGIVAIIFGVAYFLKYTFDNNWIGELGRVILGLLVGVGLTAGGEYAYTKKYKIFAEGLIAGGASFYTFLYTRHSTFIILYRPGRRLYLWLLLTLYSAIFAIRYDSPRLYYSA